MADVFEQNLPSKANLTTNDYIRAVGSDNNSYKQLVSDVAKKIIENYTGSSLAGSSQSVKSALDTLNSKTTTKYYRFYATSGAVSANADIPFTRNYGIDDNVYLDSDGKTIKFRKAGWVRIDVCVTASCTNRLWLKLSQANYVQNFISYGNYATCSISTVAQVTETSVVHLQTVEECIVNAGSTTPSVLAVTWL